MTKWKCPDDAGAGVSIGGEWFENVDGVIETPDGESYALALAPFGYVHMPPTAEELAEAAKQAAEEQALAAQQRADEAAAAAEKAAAEAADAQKAAEDAAAQNGSEQVDQAAADAAASTDDGKKSKK